MSFRLIQTNISKDKGMLIRYTHSNIRKNKELI
jgi:hypothetical protein